MRWDLQVHDVTNLVQVSQYHKIWNGLKAALSQWKAAYRLYNKDYFCINLHLKNGVHLTDIFCLLVAQRILNGSVKHQFIVTNITLIVQIRRKQPYDSSKQNCFIHYFKQNYLKWWAINFCLYNVMVTYKNIEIRNINIPDT